MQGSISNVEGKCHMCGKGCVACRGAALVMHALPDKRINVTTHPPSRNVGREGFPPVHM
jgi:hypothetical protein